MEYRAQFTPTADDAISAHRMRYRQSDDAWKAHAIGGLLAIGVFSVAAAYFRFIGFIISGVFVGLVVAAMPWMNV